MICIFPQPKVQGKLIVRPYAKNSELSYTTTLSFTRDAILPDTGTAEQAGLRRSQTRRLSFADKILTHHSFTSRLQIKLHVATQSLLGLKPTTLSYTTDTLLPDIVTAEQTGSADKILTHQSFASRWRLRLPAAIKNLFLIETHPLSLIVRHYADSSEFSQATEKGL